MNKKVLNYGIFIAIVGVVVGLALNHSRHMRYLVDTMAGNDPKARAEAAAELVKGEQFMDAVTGEPLRTRIMAAQALEDDGDKDATKQLVAYLKDPDKPVRDRCVLALIKIASKTDDSLQELVNGLKDGDVNVRKGTIAALQILGQKDLPARSNVIPKELPKDVVLANWQQRNPAVTAHIIPKVAEIIKKEGGARVSGGDVLGALKDDQGASIQALIPLLGDSDEAVRAAAADALGKVGSKDAIPLLKKAMKDSAQVRRVAIAAIAQIADPSGEGALTEAINKPDDDNDARAQAAMGLGKLATPTAIRTLIKALSDYDLKLQVAAVGALAHAGKPAVQPLLATLSSPNPDLRVRAAQALGGIQTPEANPGLIAALHDSEASVRAAAATALGYENNAAAVPPLVALLSDKDGVVSSSAADALARIGKPAQPALAQALSAGDTQAYAASRALSKQGESAVPTITQAAQSPSSQRWAVFALGNIGGQDAIAGLQKIAQTADPSTRASAQQALQKLGAK